MWSIHAIFDRMAQVVSNLGAVAKQDGGRQLQKQTPEIVYMKLGSSSE